MEVAHGNPQGMPELPPASVQRRTLHGLQVQGLRALLLLRMHGLQLRAPLSALLLRKPRVSRNRDPMKLYRRSLM